KANSYTCITLYGFARRQAERQAALLLRRGERPRRWPAPHRPPGLSRQCREGRGARQGPHGSRSSFSLVAGVWFARRSLARGAANRCVYSALVALPRSPLRTLARALSVAGGHPPRLSAGTEDRGAGLVSEHHSALSLGIPARAVPVAGFLGCF